MVSHSLGLHTHFNPNVSEFNRNKKHKNNLIALDMLDDAVTTMPLTHLELSIFLSQTNSQHFSSRFSKIIRYAQIDLVIVYLFSFSLRWISIFGCQWVNFRLSFSTIFSTWLHYSYWFISHFGMRIEFFSSLDTQSTSECKKFTWLRYNDAGCPFYVTTWTRVQYPCRTYFAPFL